LPPFKFACHILPRWQFFPATTRHINATLHLFLPQRGKFRATEWHINAKRWHINATLHFFSHLLKWWQNFSGPFRPAGPLRLVTSRKGLKLILSELINKKSSPFKGALLIILSISFFSIFEHYLK